MMKFLIILLAVFIIDRSASSPLNSVFESEDFHDSLTHSPVNFNHFVKQHREKRQISSYAANCVKRCVSTYQSSLDNAGLTTFNSKYFPVDRTLFQNNNFQEYCSSTKEYMNCVDSCGNFQGKDTLMTAFKILDFLCVDHYDEFIQYLPCYQSADQTVEDVCDEKCGDSYYYSGIEKDIYASAETKLTKICGILSCSTECAASEYVKVCKNYEAGQLLTSFAQHAMKQTVEVLKNMGVGHMVPGKCYQMIGAKTGNGASKLNYVFVSLLLPILMI